MKWDYWVTLTFTPDLRATRASAQSAVHAWLNKVEAKSRELIPQRQHHAAAWKHVYACVSIEEGDIFGRVHAHVLVGGLGKLAQWPRELQKAWGGMGNAQVSPYRTSVDPKGNGYRGASAYVTKGLLTDSSEVFVVGHLQKFRPRGNRKK